jgi:epoxyqueuosine reductase
MAPAALAALSREEFDRLAAGTALARAQYDGIRRNALLALGAARDGGARAVVARLTADASAIVRAAAAWALDRIATRSPTL